VASVADVAHVAGSKECSKTNVTPAYLDGYAADLYRVEWECSGDPLECCEEACLRT
jgi:hypothetical protein